MKTLISVFAATSAFVLAACGNSETAPALPSDAVLVEQPVVEETVEPVVEEPANAEVAPL